MFDIDSALRTLVEREGSDLHVKVDSPPIARMHGELIPLEGFGELSAEDTEQAFHDDRRGRARWPSSRRTARPTSPTRCRASPASASTAFKQRGAISIVCRAIPFEIRSIEDLGLPEVVRTLAEEQRGIVLVTGTTGSGKSTTLAAMIDHINQTRARHIVTLEDPIEYLHPDKTLDRQPARSRLRHRELRPGDATRPAPGPRRDPDRRDARRGDRAHRALRRPRPATSSSPPSTPSTRPRRSTASSTSSRPTCSSRRG